MSGQSLLIERIVRHYVISSPWLLVALGGMILALVNLRKHPRPARLLLLGTLIELFNTGILSILIYDWLVQRYLDEHGSGGIETVFTIAGFFSGLLGATGLGLMIAAVFTGRATGPEASRISSAEQEPFRPDSSDPGIREGKPWS